MNTELLVSRYRVFLLGSSVVIFIGSLVELWANDHYHSLVQMIPIGLSLFGLAGLGWVALQPGRASLRFLRVIMLMVLLGSALGIFEHLSGNLEFALEIQLNASLISYLIAMLKGANPLFAPGILAMGGVAALAATYAHPALAGNPSSNPAQVKTVREQSLGS